KRPTWHKPVTHSLGYWEVSALIDEDNLRARLREPLGGPPLAHPDSADVRRRAARLQRRKAAWRAMGGVAIMAAVLVPLTLLGAIRHGSTPGAGPVALTIEHDPRAGGFLEGSYTFVLVETRSGHLIASV